MDWGEVAVIAGITVVSTGICILCPPATPWVIAGGVAAGALAEGGMEVYKESKTGEYDWVKILTKTLGGGLKGALAASPLKPLATGLGVATTGAIEDYIYCIANGETHEQALKSAAINGPIEGLTVGGCKWLGNAVKANRLANMKNVIKEPRGIGNPVKTADIGASNGRHEAANLFEQMAMHEVKSDPLKNAVDLSKIGKPIILRDGRWLASDGWVKMQSIVIGENGNKVTIHFVYNKSLGLFDDFKFV